MNIVLIGFKNSGKTSVGKCIAKYTHKIFFDTDDLIEQCYYQQENIFLTTHEIYQKKGAAFFRDLEKHSITALSHSDLSTYNNVIATGGGTPLDNDNIMHLKKHSSQFIYLHTSYETLLSRLESQPLPAFLSHTNKNLIDIYHEREEIYKKIADITISTDNQSVRQICEEIRHVTPCY